MKPKQLNFDQGQIFEPRLSDQLNPIHPLYRMSEIIDWDMLDNELQPCFNSAMGAPGTPTRLISGLFMLQHCYGYSDEATVETWVENPYWQLFCGYDYLQWELPVDPSSMSRWRKRLGEKGLEAILRVTIRAGESMGIVKKSSFKEVITDTTVMEKNIAYPTDSRLYLKSLEAMVRFAGKHGIQLRQTYVRVGKRLARLFSRYAHAKQMKRAERELKKLKTIAGRVLREIERRLDKSEDLKKIGERLLTLVRRILMQERKDTRKIYSLHEPDVECISKGKAHKKYEFGCKASLVITHKEGFVLTCAAHHGNPYDGHILESILKRTEAQTKVPVEVVYTDKGYRGHKIEQIKVYISGTKRKLSRWFREKMNRRQAIEPRIGHMKSEGKLGRNFLKGKLGDQLNAWLCGIGENFRILLNRLPGLQPT